MSDLRQAAQMALDALEANQYAVANQAPHRDVMEYNDAIERLRAALAEQSAEPVARKGIWVGTVVDSGYGYKVIGFSPDTLASIPVGTRCYTAPQPAKS